MFEFSRKCSKIFTLHGARGTFAGPNASKLSQLMDPSTRSLHRSFVRSFRRQFQGQGLSTKPNERMGSGEGSKLKYSVVSGWMDGFVWKPSRPPCPCLFCAQRWRGGALDAMRSNIVYLFLLEENDLFPCGLCQWNVCLCLLDDFQGSRNGGGGGACESRQTVFSSAKKKRQTKWKEMNEQSVCLRSIWIVTLKLFECVSSPIACSLSLRSAFWFQLQLTHSIVVVVCLNRRRYASGYFIRVYVCMCAQCKLGLQQGDHNQLICH